MTRIGTRLVTWVILPLEIEFLVVSHHRDAVQVRAGDNQRPEGAAPGVATDEMRMRGDEGAGFISSVHLRIG